MPPTLPSSPYDPRPVEEVGLTHPPLLRVLAQVRHPSLRVLAGDQGAEAALKVAGRVAEQYPIFEPVREPGVILTPEGAKADQSTASLSWRLRSADEKWQATLAKDFVSLETSSYSGRRDFCNRLAQLLEAYSSEIDPPNVTRLGLRYTNRISSPEHLESLPSLIRTELVGPLAAKYPDDVEIALAFGQVQFRSPQGGSIMQWGLLPPKATFDLTINPIETPAWFLDIDCFGESHQRFDAAEINLAAQALAARAYSHFRWAVTEKFLSAFGG